MTMTYKYTTMLIALTISVLSACSDRVVRPFTSDGCSAFPDGTLQQKELWLDCCTAHDLAYWRGGTYDERLRADKELQACVTKVAQPELALLMLAGVRVGGTPYLPTTFRWGYGWPYPSFYRELNFNEVKQVENVSNCSSETYVQSLCNSTTAP